MIGGSLLAVLPKGFFSWPTSIDNGGGGKDALFVDVRSERDGRKRPRRSSESSDCVGGSRTPTLVSPARGISCEALADDGNDRPRKRLRDQSKLPSVPHLTTTTTTTTTTTVHTKEVKPQTQTSEFLNIVPEDAIAHCLSFLGTTEDRFALQTTCKTFRDISNSDSMLENVSVSGDVNTGKNGIILEKDTPATAASTLAPFARAGNLEALYMYVASCVLYVLMYLLYTVSNHPFVPP